MKKEVKRHAIPVAAVIGIQLFLSAAGIKPLDWLAMKACRAGLIDVCAHRPGEVHECPAEKEVTP
jgi:hypothetical protein